MSPQTMDEPAHPAGRHSRLLQTTVLLLTLIALAAVIHRGVALFTPPRPDGLGAEFDQVLLSNREATLIHISLGLLYLLLAPFQFSSGLRLRRPGLHRTMGRVTLVIGLATGASALLMAYHTTIGGVNETAAILLFDLLFVASLAMGWREIRRGAVAAHREWMIRAFAIGLVVGTIRPIVALFFIASRFNGLQPHEFFGTAFWIGFALHLIAAQLWIDWSRPRAQPPVLPA